jgi:hypothetical protein
LFGLHTLRRRKRVMSIGLTTVLAVAVALAAMASSAFADITGPALTPAGATGPVTMTVSPTTSLTDGQSISIHAVASGATMTELRAHICANNIGTVNQAKFNFTGTFCFSELDATPPGAHLGGNTAATRGSYETFQSYGNVAATGTPTDPDLVFKAGTGSVSWNDEGASPTNHTLTCNVSNSCTLVVQIQSSAGLLYFKAPLSYAPPAAPGAPTLVTATSNENAQSTLTWTAGTGSVDNYVITTTGGISPPAPVTVAGNVLTTPISGLTNFSTYTFSVQAVNNLSVPTTSVASNTLTATPQPPKPGTPVVTLVGPGTHSVNLTWTAPAGPSVPDNYRITVFIAHVAQPSPIDTGSASPAFTVGGLTDGLLYSFTVTAHYNGAPGNFGPASLESGQVAPISALITQTITVTRAQGALVLTQACAGSDPYPDTDTVPGPVGDVSDVVYPTNCSFDLGTATLIKTGPNAGQYFQATGAMRTVTVVDTRDTDPGWNASGSVSDFETADHLKHFSGNNLYWAPVVSDKSAQFSSPDGDYAMVVTAGATVAPPLAAGSGLHSSRLLATAPAHDGIFAPGTLVHGGLGITHLDAPLTLWIPVFNKAGTYTAVLTITAL